MCLSATPSSAGKDSTSTGSRCAASLSVGTWGRALLAGVASECAVALARSKGSSASISTAGCDVSGSRLAAAFSSDSAAWARPSSVSRHANASGKTWGVDSGNLRPKLPASRSRMPFKINGHACAVSSVGCTTPMAAGCEQCSAARSRVRPSACAEVPAQISEISRASLLGSWFTGKAGLRNQKGRRAV